VEATDCCGLNLWYEIANIVKIRVRVIKTRRVWEENTDIGCLLFLRVFMLLSLTKRIGAT